MGASVSSLSSRTSTKAINASAPAVAASSADLYFTSQFRLLELSTDVLTIVLSFLNDESLTTLRRTCKVLDRVIFDRFADRYFAHMHCWTFTTDALTRLKDIMQDSPRLRDRIRKVTLTDSFLEDKSVDDLHLVTQQNQSDHWAQYWSAEAYIDTCDDSHLGLTLAHRVFMDLQRLPQDVTITLDFINRELFGKKRYYRARQEIYFALITSQTKVHGLVVQSSTLEHLENIVAYNRAEFLDCMSTLQILRSTLHWHHYDSPEEDEQLMFTEILRGAKQLRDLTFEISMSRDEEVCYQRNCPLLKVPSEILLAGNYSNLTSLKLVHFAVTVNDLEQILRQCQQTLERLTLRRVCLTTGDAGWERIGKILHPASRLQYLQLQMMHASDEPEDPLVERHFICPEIEDGNPPGFTVRERENVGRALEKLSQLGASMFEQLNRSICPCCGDSMRS